MKKWLTLALVLCLLASGACGMETQEEPAVLDWGVTLSAKDVTATGCTVVIRQRGGSPTGELEFGAPFWIEILTSSGWMEFPTTAIVDWIDIAYTIPKEGETQWDCTWERLYGTLPQGTYRLGKEILDWRAPGNYDRQTCYAMFTIQ